MIVLTNGKVGDREVRNSISHSKTFKKRDTFFYSFK